MRFLILCFCCLVLFIFNTALARDISKPFDTTTATVGQVPTGTETPVNQLVTPAGTFVELPHIRPNALALSPDGKLLITSGLTHELVVLDPLSGKVLQHVPFPKSRQTLSTGKVAEGDLNPDQGAKLSFTGLTFSPDGSRIYLSNVNGDIKVFGIGKDHHVSALFSIPVPPADTPGRKAAIPTGIAVSADGKRIYVALNLSNRLVELDAATGRVLRIWAVGVAPYDVVLADHKAYVSNWGGRRPRTNSMTGAAGRGMRVRVG